MASDSYWEVQNKRGTFRLKLRQRGGPGLAIRICQADKQNAWYELNVAMRRPNWIELAPILELYAELRGRRILPANAPTDRFEIECMLDASGRRSI